MDFFIIFLIIFDLFAFVSAQCLYQFIFFNFLLFLQRIPLCKYCSVWLSYQMQITSNTRSKKCILNVCKISNKLRTNFNGNKLLLLEIHSSKIKMYSHCTSFQNQWLDPSAITNWIPNTNRKTKRIRKLLLKSHLQSRIIVKTLEWAGHNDYRWQWIIRTATTTIAINNGGVGVTIAHAIAHLTIIATVRC